jgi:hypothetical protein
MSWRPDKNRRGRDRLPNHLLEMPAWRFSTSAGAEQNSARLAKRRRASSFWQRILALRHCILALTQPDEDFNRLLRRCGFGYFASGPPESSMSSI